MNLKLNSVKLLLCLVIGAFVASCGEDESKPKTLATVETGTATDITPTTATFSGTITDDGNDEITERGVVYSNVVGVPEITEDKEIATGTEDEFTSALEDLISGTTYHVRAYAINSKGVAYGTVVDFTTGNLAPTATNVTITGDQEVNKTVTGTYTFTDAEGDGEGTSTYKWYVADNAGGLNETVIADETEQTYYIPADKQGKFISFGVTPVADDGTLQGVEVRSTYTNAVGEATTVTFPYNGATVTYGILTSTVTGRKWLDRNLGAPNAPTSYNDFANYGDLFQWGRRADGHQLIIHNGNSAAETQAVNEPEIQGPSDTHVPTHQFFILPDPNVFGGDWLATKNNDLWQGVNGINNPCPEGWRIPTREEFDNELSETATIQEGYTVFKLTLSGIRSNLEGALADQGVQGYYWTHSFTSAFSVNAVALQIAESGINIGPRQRGFGMSCRCIKD